MNLHHYDVDLSRLVSLRQYAHVKVTVDVPKGMDPDSLEAQDLAEETADALDDSRLAWVEDWGSDEVLETLHSLVIRDTTIPAADWVDTADIPATVA